MSRLDDYLKAHGISRRRLAQMTGLDLRTISRLCNQNSRGRMDTWRVIADALGCRIGDIVD